MRKFLLVTLAILFFSFTSEAKRGFVAKVYDQNNINFANVAVDYDNNKVKVQTNNPDIDYVIILRYSNMDKTVLYINVILTSLYNNGHYDESKVETFVFETNKSLLSTPSSTIKRRYELCYLERNL